MFNPYFLDAHTSYLKSPERIMSPYGLQKSDGNIFNPFQKAIKIISKKIKIQWPQPSQKFFIDNGLDSD